MSSLTEKKCSVESCDRKHKAKGYCTRHYQRLKINGSVQADKPIRTLHRLKGSPTYSSWSSMKHRCNNSNNAGYHLYGGRGIKVCEQWNEFRGFLKDMGVRPKETSLDRIDSNKGYTPENCRWATAKEQGRNTRNTKLNMIKANTIRKMYKSGRFTQSYIADKFNIHQTQVSLIVNNKEWL